MMKKRTIGILTVLGFLALTSCQKEYTCTCDTLLLLNGGGIVDKGETYTTNYKSADEATLACQAREDDLNGEENQTATCVSSVN